MTRLDFRPTMQDFCRRYGVYPPAMTQMIHVFVDIAMTSKVVREDLYVKEIM